MPLAEPETDATPPVPTNVSDDPHAEEKVAFLNENASKISEEALREILEILKSEYPDAIMEKDGEHYCNLTRIPAEVWEKIRAINIK